MFSIRESGFLVVFGAGGKLVLNLLFFLHFPRVLAGKMPVRQRVEGFQFLPLLLPLGLARGRILGLRGDGFSLQVDGFVETVQELLEIVPFALGQAFLGRLAEAGSVLVAILLQHLQFGLADSDHWPWTENLEGKTGLPGLGLR